MKQLKAPTTYERVSKNLKVRQEVPLFGKSQCNKSNKQTTLLHR